MIVYVKVNFDDFAKNNFFKPLTEIGLIRINLC